MMKIKKEYKLVLCFLLLLSCLFSKEYAAAFINPFLQSQQKRLYMKRDGNFRVSNNINSSIITALDSGTVVTEIEEGKVNGWFHVELEDGTTGWIYQSLLKSYTYDSQTEGGQVVASKIDRKPGKKSEESKEEVNKAVVQEKVGLQSKDESVVSIKTDKEPEKKSEESKKEVNKAALQENVDLKPDRKSMDKSVPLVIENPVNKYLLILTIFLLLTSVVFAVLFNKYRQKPQNIKINSKTVKELENYKKKDEKNNEKILLLEKKISQLKKEMEEESIQIEISKEPEIKVNNKNVKELENYKKKNEKNNEKISFLERKISQLEKEMEEENAEVMMSDESKGETISAGRKIAEKKKEPENKNILGNFV